MTYQGRRIDFKDRWAIWAPVNWPKRSLFILQIDTWDSPNSETVDIFKAKNYLAWNPIEGWEDFNKIDLSRDRFFVLSNDIFQSRDDAQRAMIAKVFENG